MERPICLGCLVVSIFVDGGPGPERSAYSLPLEVVCGSPFTKAILEGHMISRILLCCDGSQHALKAAEIAGEIATKFQAEITLLSVFVPPPMPISPFDGPTMYIDI